jgi:hypothetical protein
LPWLKNQSISLAAGECTAKNISANASKLGLVDESRATTVNRVTQSKIALLSIQIKSIQAIKPQRTIEQKQGRLDRIKNRSLLKFSH